MQDCEREVRLEDVVRVVCGWGNGAGTSPGGAEPLSRHDPTCLTIHGNTTIIHGDDATKIIEAESSISPRLPVCPRIFTLWTHPQSSSPLPPVPPMTSLRRAAEPPRAYIESPQETGR